MARIKFDVIRSLSLGFGLGALGVFATIGGTVAHAAVPTSTPAGFVGAAK